MWEEVRGLSDLRVEFSPLLGGLPEAGESRTGHEEGGHDGKHRTTWAPLSDRSVDTDGTVVFKAAGPLLAQKLYVRYKGNKDVGMPMGPGVPENRVETGHKPAKPARRRWPRQRCGRWCGAAPMTVEIEWGLRRRPRRHELQRMG